MLLEPNGSWRLKQDEVYAWIRAYGFDPDEVRSISVLHGPSHRINLPMGWGWEPMPVFEPGRELEVVFELHVRGRLPKIRRRRKACRSCRRRGLSVTWRPLKTWGKGDDLAARRRYVVRRPIAGKPCPWPPRQSGYLMQRSGAIWRFGRQPGQVELGRLKLGSTYVLPSDPPRMRIWNGSSYQDLAPGEP